MGTMKDAIERLRQQEQLTGWVDRKLGEAQLVSDALPSHDAAWVDQMINRREDGQRHLVAGEASRLHALHKLHVQPAIEHATQYETNAERSERAKALQAKKGAARAPEANDDPHEEQLVATAKKSNRRKAAGH